MSVSNHHVVYPEMIIACREEDLGTGNPRFFRGYGGELGLDSLSTVGSPD
jgi:hypothetical protein